MMPYVAKYFDYLCRNNEFGRNILVLGKGKCTFCTAMANYIVRMHKTSIISVIDPASGFIFPGVIGWLAIDSIIDYSEGIKLNNPTCYFYGDTEIKNSDLYDIQIEEMSKELEELSKEASGEKNASKEAVPEESESIQGQLNMIIAPQMAQEELNRIIKKFKVKEVVFLGDERMYNSMKLIVDMIFIDNGAYIQENSVINSINRYFNGPRGEYSPCSFIAKIGKGVVRIGEEHAAPESALPLGATRKVEKTSVNHISPIEGHVLAISEAENEEGIATSKISGFVVCQNSETFRVLCPQPKLPKNYYLVQGNIKYSDY